MVKRLIVVNDLMQKDYQYYLTEPSGTNFHSEFLPALSPKLMLQMGIFGGKYMTDCIKEFPSDWFENARLSPHKRDPKLNYFGVNASQSLSVWQDKGWIHYEDPRGWFQWYCRYYFGRRCVDDDRQIMRWRQMSRHVGQIRKNCAFGDLDCRPRQRQALLHWAYDSREI
ncbi:MAG: hypothetical protein CL606_04730 [Anaerolineaceae bacterium]|nr:hypothetical protein [Anaerolineaceae bacterium]|tara:strand:+ start:10997 stop:11503 length:507 start_codon:yes stop_codon:yes gene_type:complete